MKKIKRGTKLHTVGRDVGAIVTRRRSKQGLQWGISSFFQAVVTYKKKVLSFTIITDGKGFQVVAVEAHKDANIAGILEQHGHEALGEFATLDKAQIAAQKYADKWEAVEACKCKTIPKQKKGEGKRRAKK